MSKSESKSGGAGNTVSYSHKTSTTPAATVKPTSKKAPIGVDLHDPHSKAPTPSVKQVATPGAKPGSTPKTSTTPAETKPTTKKPWSKPTATETRYGPADISNPYSNVGSSAAKDTASNAGKVGTAEFKPTAGTYQPSHVSEPKVHTNPYGTSHGGYGKTTYNTDRKVDVAAGKTEAHYKLGNSATGSFNSTHSIASNGVKAAEHGVAEKAGGMLSKVHLGHVGLLGAGLAVGGLAGYALKGNN